MSFLDRATVSSVVYWPPANVGVRWKTMGDLRSFAWMVAVAACSAAAPPAPAPPGQCQPSSTGSGPVELVSISPNVVPLHGGDVELTFDGAMPPSQSIFVNGVAAPLDGKTLHVPPTPYVGPLSIQIGEDPHHPMASLACAGQYAEAPDSVALSETPAGLLVPLHPELAHECARIGYVDVTNNGDAPFVIYPDLTGSPGFETIFPEDECPLPMFYDSCQILMCFSSNVSMTHTAHLVVPSTATTASLDFTATVLPPTPGLDVARWRPYTTDSQEQVRGVTALPDGKVAVWDESPAITFEMVTSSGASERHWMGAMTTLSQAAFRTMRAGATGQGIYAIVGNTVSGQHHALIHFDDGGARDAAFGEIALDSDSYFPSSAIQVQPGRVLAIGTTTVTAVVASGALDPSWGTAGVLDFSAYGTFTGANAMDDSGRLYLATTHGVIRIVAPGSIDPGFRYADAVTALAIAAGSPLVAGAGVIARLDDTGAAAAVPLAPAPQLARPIVDLATDASGQLYLITDDGQLVRFTAGGQLDGVRGFDGANRIACPQSGDCAVVGLASGLDKYVIELAP
jgi:hypothetical protein